MLKVLHLIHSFLPVTENWIYSQLQFNDRCESTVLCRYRQNGDQFPFDAVHAAYPEYSMAAKIDHTVARLRARYPKGFASRVIRSVRPDIIHGHFASESWRYLPAVLESGVPLVTTFYGVDISMLPRRLVWRRRYGRLFEVGAAFIVEGTFMAERLARLGCPQEKIHCIPIGVDVDALRGLPVDRGRSGVRVLFVGLGREKKGAVDATEAFILAAGGNPGLRFDLVGDGPFRVPVESRLKAAGLLDRCTFHGALPVAEYRRLLGRVDLLLAPSYTTPSGDDEGGAPVVVIEAQAAGLPVVGTLHCDIPMVVENGVSGILVPEHAVSALADAMGLLGGDQALRGRMGEAGAARAALRHDIRRQVGEIRRVYEEGRKKADRRQ